MQKQETRVPFQDQMCQAVIVDTLSSAIHGVQTFTKSLLRSVTLAASVRGAARVPALGLLALGRAPTICWQMQEPRGRLDRLGTAVAQLVDRARLDPGAVSTDDDGTGRLEFALDIVNTEFDDFCSKQVRTPNQLSSIV
ncbi:hypothetical protein FJT64_009387 [Amphibalanus amphitrite]|uniref:Uncharacterized protein n=1 Tax=Amphibalanus amphitrite TaxID=1232801 RepID=A0A6A4VGH8_AMPAM|nr:hypothetical protein FJT64_009387 [Amphibalanus amphitrite]KAF0292643.1 hypothetical protein FJT64_009387 [Amphibalanus amphitrite]